MKLNSWSTYKVDVIKLRRKSSCCELLKNVRNNHTLSILKIIYFVKDMFTSNLMLYLYPNNHKMTHTFHCVIEKKFMTEEKRFKFLQRKKNLLELFNTTKLKCENQNKIFY